MAQSWHNKHISTQWGITITGFLLVAIVLLIPVLKQEQDNRSDAAYTVGEGSGRSIAPTSIPSHSRCTAMAGKCTTVGKESPKGGVFLTGYCPGPSNFKCYITPYQAAMNCYSDGSPASAKCTSAQKAVADVNRDGKVNALDVNTILRR